MFLDKLFNFHKTWLIHEAAFGCLSASILEMSSKILTKRWNLYDGGWCACKIFFYYCGVKGN